LPSISVERKVENHCCALRYELGRIERRNQARRSMVIQDRKT
jgi:hypothetical protein